MGIKWPRLGLGTGPLKGETRISLLTEAIRMGYRLLDSAAHYNNEKEVGEAVRASGVPRDEIIVVTKAWPDKIGASDLRASAEASLERLGMAQVDLFLLHWPNPTIPLAETMAALAKLQEDGLARHIGVSNFPTTMLAEARELSPVPLVANEVEYHPYLSQDAVLAACRTAGMAMIAHCPLGRAGPLFEEPAVKAAAQRLGRSPAQVVLRWHVQQKGVIAIPSSHKVERLKENFSVFDFALSAEEMAAISALQARNRRLCVPPVPYEFDAA
jgi:diketogulonate reductase-like aldo/keto reductase